MDDFVFTVFTVCTLVTTPITVLGQCPPDKFGPGCRYSCHCKPHVTCDPESGCPGECAEGWDGPTCQRQNVALKQTAVQTPTTILLASHAVDGKRGHDLWNTPCSVTAWTDDLSSPSEWTLTLDQEYNINRFIIDLRDCCRDRMINFTLSVGQTSIPGFNYRKCYIDQTTSRSGPGETLNGQCSSTLRGDIVRIRTAKNTPLELCEVLLPGCNVGKFGPDCNFTCGFCAEGVKSCDIIHGNCSLNQNQTRCKTGYYGVRCDSAYESGTWGEDCGKNCSINCDRQECDGRTGHCVKCVPGYEGDFCDTARTKAEELENPARSPPTVRIIAGSVGAVFIIVVVVLAVIICRRHYLKTDEERVTGRIVQCLSPPCSKKVQSPHVHTGISTEQPQYETVDNHDYSQIRRSAMGEENKYTSLS